MKKIDHEHLIHLEEIYETSKVSNLLHSLNLQIDSVSKDL